MCQLPASYTSTPSNISIRPITPGLLYTILRHLCHGAAGDQLQLHIHAATNTPGHGLMGKLVPVKLNIFRYKLDCPLLCLIIYLGTF